MYLRECVLHTIGQRSNSCWESNREMSLLVHQLLGHLKTATLCFCITLLLKENVILIPRQIYYRIPILLCQHSYLS